MADERQSDDDRSEAPTAGRLRKARDTGDVPISGEVILLAGSVGLLITWLVKVNLFSLELPKVFFECLSLQDSWIDRPGATSSEIFEFSLFAIASIVSPSAVASAAATLLQTRCSFNTKSLRPSLGRLSPKAGIIRLLSARNSFESALSISKAFIIGSAVAGTLYRQAVLLSRSPGLPFLYYQSKFDWIAFHLIATIILAQLGIATIDYLYRRHVYVRRLSMSRGEIKEEIRQSEGDPTLKARLNRLRLHRSKQSLITSVAAATVVVTNPTHYAVALSYQAMGDSVPMLTAKGADFRAARIRSIAIAHNIPVIANPILARALHKLPVGSPVPAEHYRLVAEIIFFVTLLRNRKRENEASSW